MMKNLFWVPLLLLAAANVSAMPITCGGADRTATLDSAEECKTGAGNTKGNGSTINGHYGGSWSGEGSLEGNGSDSYLTTMLTSGSWGGKHVEGTWAIDNDFWNTFAEAVISIHVGNGGGDPDHFAWVITANETSGTWSYDKLQGGGGGLSNMKLWGRGEATQVSEPGTFALLSLALLGFAFSRKKA
ncbi:PEP-CTERM sorting domain-containing protein [Alkalimarinus alittae]|uniref:PEP-CTERM sorting domain-containing protein n=1 Tax=Alkalimarinus alittae TaxID=2961619 RepID=A0ABY6N1I6_9ALTE|nr:PEP-CTERM sorting domain-containing protein [Alkalimarinus alittae]UZE95978.1 PEP-CTERM sorting domain-containing protein [Alkalimarinus alittae]